MDQPPTGTSAAVHNDPTGSLAATIPESRVDIRGGIPSSDSTIRGGTTQNSVRFDSATTSTQRQAESSNPPRVHVLTVTHDDDDWTVSTVNTDSEASLINDMINSDADFHSIRLNSLLISRVPDEVITIDDLEEQEWTDDDKSCDEEEYRDIQMMTISELATKAKASDNPFVAHLDGGSQVSTTHDKSALWGMTLYTERRPCKV